MFENFKVYIGMFLGNSALEVGDCFLKCSYSPVPTNPLVSTQSPSYAPGTHTPTYIGYLHIYIYRPLNNSESNTFFNRP